MSRVFLEDCRITQTDVEGWGGGGTHGHVDPYTLVCGHKQDRLHTLEYKYGNGFSRLANSGRFFPLNSTTLKLDIHN